MRTIRLAVVSLGLLLSLAGALLLSSCVDYSPEFVVSDTAYSKASAMVLLRDVSAGDIAAEPTADAANLRQKALTALRSEGAEGSEAADFITKSFPANTAAVPVHVEQARFEGQDAWLIVEAIGQPGGRLEDKRLWVVTTSGDVLYSAID